MASGGNRWLASVIVLSTLTVAIIVLSTSKAPKTTGLATSSAVRESTISTLSASTAAVLMCGNPLDEYPCHPRTPCEPGSSLDCTNHTDDGQWRYIVGYGECVAYRSGFGNGFEGTCSDLEGDGHAGYPDSG